MKDLELRYSGDARGSSSDLPHDAILVDEVELILASAAFRRAPILSRLLRYLLDRTLAGDADTLKAYTVAVDGLARSPDFDPQFDSYPRVQMVRLRKALETYYCERPLLDELGVFLCVRSYRLQLVNRHAAYSIPGEPQVSDVRIASIFDVAPLSRGFWSKPVPRWAVLLMLILFAGLSAAVVIIHN